MPNLYATPTEFKARPGMSAATPGSLWLALIEAASRAVDAACSRYFYTETATKTFDGHASTLVHLPDDLISITTLKTDSEADGTYDGETWTANTDYILYPENSYPKWGIMVPSWGNYSFGSAPSYIRIAGVWGYGDGTSNPWATTAVTGTVGTTSGTTLTISVSAGIEAGTTIKCGTEQMYVSAVSGTSATVTRGVNGTTAAIQAAAVISTAKYPTLVKEATLMLARNQYQRDSGSMESLQSEKIGDYEYTRVNLSTLESAQEKALARYINSLVRAVV